MTVDKKLVECFKILASPQMAPFREYLESELRQEMEALCEETSIETVWRRQGSCHALKGLLDAIASQERGHRP